MAKKKTKKWDLIIAIPAINLKNDIDGNDLIAIGQNDKRYQQICKDKNLSKYLNSFSTPFKRKIKPSIVIKPSNTKRPIL